MYCRLDLGRRRGDDRAEVRRGGCILGTFPLDLVCKRYYRTTGSGGWGEGFEEAGSTCALEKMRCVCFGESLACWCALRLGFPLVVQLHNCLWGGGRGGGCRGPIWHYFTIELRERDGGRENGDCCVAKYRQCVLLRWWLLGHVQSLGCGRFGVSVLRCWKGVGCVAAFAKVRVPGARRSCTSPYHG